jgi:outer membrane lipoprotein-sorting protein
MNCAESRDYFIACAEGLLQEDQARQCRAHLETCASCRAEYEAISRLQQRLIARGQAAAGVRMVESVMSRIRQEQFKPERETIMSRLMKHGWGFGLSAAAGAAAIVSIILWTMPNAQAAAEAVMTQGAQAVARLTSIHLRGQLRTEPNDNFSGINPDADFCTIELWKQFAPDLKGLKWRVEKPGRVVVMDGKTTVMLIKPAKTGVKVEQPTASAFDTEWLHRIANLSNTISNEVKNARAKGWKVSMAEETGADGKAKSVVTILAKSGVPDNEWGKNWFYDSADTRRVYRFDAQSKLLESVRIYLERPVGEVQIFDLSQIDFNQAIDAAEWTLDVPADASWAGLPDKLPILPDNDKYVSMTAEQAARAFFEACARKDWEEAGKFMSPVTEDMKTGLGGVEIVSLGESFASKTYGGRFVPYDIKLSREMIVRMANTNAAHRYVIMAVCDSNLESREDLHWTNGPAVLPDNDAYARMSPAEAMKAYAAAFARFNWDEMKKFAPDYDVEHDKAQCAEVEKSGQDAHKLLPQIEVGEAFWSAEQSGWFVKCRLVQDRAWNLAIRNDNAARRWQVDGGIGW